LPGAHSAPGGRLPPNGGRERFVKKYIIYGSFILIILIGLSVLLYPTVSNYYNSKGQSRAVARYLDDVANLDDTKKQTLLEAARTYNKSLLRNPGRFDLTEQDTVEYNKLLDTGRGVMGILVIDKLNIKLPIYHGTDEGVLQIGIGHMPGTSLPVGGTGTHAFITGHRGLPSSTLLSELDKMAEDDTFTLYILDETLTYQIDEIQTVEPHEVKSLAIDPDMDYCTLVTCTPYGINTHRMLVRGHRIESAAHVDFQKIYADAKWLDKLTVILIFLIPVVLVFVTIFIIKSIKISKGEIIR